MYVFDATPVIYLAKVERLDLLAELDGERVTPERVYEEVVTDGIEAGYADARRIERAVTEDELVEPVTVEHDETFRRLASNDKLSPADAAVLALAAHEDATAVVDDGYARDVADAEGIDTRGTAYLVLRFARDRVVDADAARETIDEMVEAGWHCSPSLYAKLTRRIEELD